MRRILVLFFLSVLASIYVHAQYTFNIKRTFSETGHQIYCSSYNTGGNYIVSIGYDNNIIIWNAETGSIYRTLNGLKKRPLTAIIAPQNDFVASAGEDNIITFWDIKTSNVITTFEGLQGNIKTLDISPDGKLLAAGGSDRTIRIWDINTRALLFVLKEHKGDVNALKFSPDGKLLASGGADKMLFLWNISNGSIIKSKEVQKNWISDIDFSPDGNFIATCGFDNLIQIINIPGFVTINTLSGHKDWVQTIDFSPDGKFLLSGGRDQVIILWDVVTGKILSRSEKQGQYVLSVDFCPSRPDFISTTLMSEKLETWALSGFDETKWQKPAETVAAIKIPDDGSPDNQQVVIQEKAINAGQQSVSASMIEIFSPSPIQGKIVHDKNSISFVGRVSDPQGINTFLINRNVIKLSEGGVFQYSLNLAKGENQVDLVAINNKGTMNEQRLVVECIATNAIAAGDEIPEIEKSRYLALLIGVSEYQHDEIADLDNPVKDAESLYNVLLSKYKFDKENIIFLKNPTQVEIFSTFEYLGNNLTSNDNLLVFYAGHGYWDAKTQVGYWFPSDASRNSKANWFSNSQLRDLLSGIQTKHTILIADACFSGAIFKSRAAFAEAPQGIQKLYEIPSRKAMTSGILQEVPDESKFIKYLVQKLEENKEKYFPSEILFSSFKEAVMNNSPNIPRFGVIQNVGDEGGGDFIFILK